MRFALAIGIAAAALLPANTCPGSIGIAVPAQNLLTDPVVAGSDIVYQLEVSSEGPDDALKREPHRHDTSWHTFVSVSAPAGWICGGVLAGASGTLTCTIPAFLPGRQTSS